MSIPFRLRCVTLCFAALLSLVACSDSRNGTPATDSAATGTQDDPAAAGVANGQGDEPPTTVGVVPVQRRSLQGWVYSQGTARSRQREFLTFTQQGQVSHVAPELRVGSPVKQGQVIAHQAPERVRADLQAARAALAEAEANLKLAEVTQARYQTLIDQRSASQQELDQAVVQVQQAKAARESARAQVTQAQVSLDETRLVSPIDGVLARLNIEQGRYFMPSTVQTNTEQNALRTVPALVINPRRFEVRVDLPSYDFRQIETGARAVIGDAPPLDGQDVDPVVRDGGVPGRVHAISPSLDPETRTFEIIVHTEGDNPGLQDGEFVAVWVAQPQLQDVLAVPMDAVRHRSDQSFVFVVDPQSARAAERRVELGQASVGYLAVLEGLEEGELVVTQGRAALHDGQQVRMLPGERSSP